VGRLKELQERRAFECRLTPDRALQSLDDGEQFLRDRGLLTRTPDCALPSLFEACHEDPYAPGSPGFGQWPATKWPWFGELAGRGYPALKVHRGKSILVTDRVATLLDPICRSELERMEREGGGWNRLLRHLAEAGPSAVDDLLVELDLRPKELRDLRSPLERVGAVVARSVVDSTADGGHVHTSELARWDQLFPEPSRGPGGIDELIVAGVRAAVVSLESDVRKWFSWSWLLEADAVERLMAEGRLERPESGWIALPERE
jgi:hypothetical protein